MNVDQIRSAFLEFFKANGHEVCPSSSLVPQNDPTLMFSNAGMNQFKNVFTGQEKLPYARAASSQKCVRAGGKHNDLDNVGYTARHHTFFEMLGNFSFGDYFKEKAIELAWKFLTVECKIPAEKLTVTIYHTDDEAFAHWKKISSLPDHKIIRIATNDNFWSMGDTGPCGPCSEIFYDHGEHIWGGPPGSPEQDGDRFVEIWNLVFMQYEQLSPGERVNLPKPSIDTGMGLERIAAVLQGVHNNYDIDLFKNLIAEIKRISQKMGATQHGKEAETAYKVIADHLRSTCFLMADGVLPSNEGRGYVLRRIMRRAMRYAHQLGCNEPLMYLLVPALVKEMGKHYPELVRAEALMHETLKAEEERFKLTLDRGLKLLEEETAKLSKGGKLSGIAAFKLYDTFGFPLDLTQDILRGLEMEVDLEGFEKAMDSQRDMARAAHKGSGDSATSKIWFALKEDLGTTAFLGYEQDDADAAVTAIVKNGESVQLANQGDEVFVVLDKTPFYGESGGQIGDTGLFTHGAMTLAEIIDTQKPLEDFLVHKAILQAPLGVGAQVKASIDNIRRTRIRANHSATHLLHKALRETLGDHVTQKGSLVTADKLRFDFSHPKGMARDEITLVERKVNDMIWRNTPVESQETSPEEAMKSGAMALFGEKYGDKVRVLSMGHADDGHYSVELCGGTHVHATGDIGLFKILSETAVASGVRRIEAVTRQDAFEYFAAQETTLKDLGDSLKTPVAEIPTRVSKLAADVRKLEKDLAEAKKQLALGGGSSGAVAKEMIGSVGFVGKIFDDVAPKDLRPLAESFLKQAEPGVAVVATGFEGKASLVIAVSKALTSTISAVTLVQTAVEILGGKGGGGRPEMAQGGGPDVESLEKALEMIKKSLA